jgi:hypothetical protein
MNDNLKSKIAQAASSGPDMRVVDKPSQGALFAENKQLEAKLTEANPGKLVTVRDKPQYKPDDFCEKYARLFIRRPPLCLWEERLQLPVLGIVDLLVDTYGTEYKVTSDWLGQQRRVKPKPSGKGLFIGKVVAALKAEGIDVPNISVDEMSFDDLRIHLRGRGSKQEKDVQFQVKAVLGTKRVVINGLTFYWVNAMGQRCLPENAVGLRGATSPKRPDAAGNILLMEVVESILGETAQELVRRSHTNPQT